MTRVDAIAQFIETTDFSGAELVPLAGDASFRRYVRVNKDGRQAMLMDAPPENEDVRPFIAVAEHLHRAGYSVPAIMARDVGQGFLLLEDLGDASFASVLKQCTADQKDSTEQALYGAAIDLLAAWHKKDTQVAHPEVLPLPRYDEALLLKEVALFCDWFLPQCLGKETAISLRQEYLALWKELLADVPLETRHFVHRDYHADNLMWLPDRQGVQRVGLLDFQDGVYGDEAYDLVSLLEDARRDVAAHTTQEMLARYIKVTDADKERFMLRYALLGAQRNSKIVGIFSRLAARDNKMSYLNFLPRVWGHLAHDVTHPALASLRIWLDAHVPQSARGVITIRHTSSDLALSA